MFQKFVVLSAFVAVALCASISEPEVVQIVSQTNEAASDGSKFNWKFESADGTAQQQSGEVINVDKDTAVETVQGSVVYTDPIGHKHEFTYVADQNGYQPQGADIPVPPPTPKHVLETLAYQEAHPQVVVKSAVL